MLKFLPLGAALAAALSIPTPNSALALSENTANQERPASPSELVVTDATLNAATNDTNTKPLAFVADASSNPLRAGKVGGSEALLGITAIAGTAGVLWGVSKTKHPFKPSSRRPYSSSGLGFRGADAIRLDQTSRDLQRKLLRLVHNDRDTATRLLSQAKLRNPDRSMNWCAEKAIYDLERDRGRY